MGIELSKQGDNSYAFFCEYHGQRRYYNVCLNLMERNVEAPEENTCGHAMKCGSCEAKAMRQEEIEKDEAIYYVQRQGSLDRPKKPAQELNVKINGDAYRRGWSLVNSQTEPAISHKTARPTAKPERLGIKEMDFAEVVNQMVSDDKQKVTGSEYQEMLREAKALSASGEMKDKLAARELAGKLKHLRDNNLIERGI